MKYSAAVLAFAAAVAAQPAFLNTQFNVVTGQPFTLQYSGCEAGCTILLKSGPSGNLNTVQTLTSMPFLVPIGWIKEFLFINASM